MKMRNPLKPKNKARRFAELQEDQGFSDAQFETPETPIPWNAIGLATLLFTVGGILLALGILIKIGTITSEVCTILWVTEKLLLSDQCMDRYGWQEEHHSLFLEVSCSSLVPTICTLLIMHTTNILDTTSRLYPTGINHTNLSVVQQIVHVYIYKDLRLETDAVDLFTIYKRKRGV
ncbi:unnamed protein product [Mucor fragilis]